MVSTDYAITVVSLEPLRASAVFSQDYPAFDGHFPGEPLLPGFMHVQLGLDVLKAAGLQYGLIEVNNAKFVGAILPLMRVRVEMNGRAMAAAAGGAKQYDVTLAKEDGGALSAFTVTVE